MLRHANDVGTFEWGWCVMRDTFFSKHPHDLRFLHDLSIRSSISFLVGHVTLPKFAHSLPFLYPKKCQPCYHLGACLFINYEALILAPSAMTSSAPSIVPKNYAGEGLWREGS
jgi:hypothetical protein